MCANHSTIGAIAPVTGIEPALLITCNLQITIINPLDVFSAYPQHIYTNILNYCMTPFERMKLVSFNFSSFAGLTGLEPAILGLTNLRCIPLKLQTNLLWGLSVTLRSL